MIFSIPLSYIEQNLYLQSSLKEFLNLYSLVKERERERKWKGRKRQRKEREERDKENEREERGKENEYLS